jgi:PAS domain S-box-containing protein
MRISLRAKLTAATAILVLAVVAAVSTVYVATLTKQVIRQTNERADFVARQMFLQAQHALSDAADRGEGPVSSSPTDIRAYVRRTLELSTGWNSAVLGALSYSPSIYEITITDPSGNVLLSSDDSLADKPLPRRENLQSLVRASFRRQIEVIYGPPRAYEATLPFDLGSEPFGDVRVAISTTLFRQEIAPALRSALGFALGAVLLSALLAILLSSATLAPLHRITAQLDSITAGGIDLEPIARKDEFGAVSTKISRIGRELRDVRKVFSTLRDNLNQIMTRVQDGLLLLNAESRVVLASPSIDRFLGMRNTEIMGRDAGELFPEGHPIREVLQISGNQITPVEAAEVTLDGSSGVRRAAVSAQAISEGGSRMGTLVTLHDLDSFARIDNELEISERLAALGRVTAGVAHEVKNPLNSMRVWLEVLKTNLPAGPEPLEAVTMLDSEIERLDRVVKTFLDFNRPLELQWEEADLPHLLADALAAARTAIESGGITVRTNVPGEFPAVRLDPELIHQVILNLVLNACDAMPPGGLLTISLAQELEMVELSVADTGKGISAENQRKIFQLFFTTRPGGSGIGLANAFRFVQLHNGSIEFESEPSRGTTFHVRLPLAHAGEPSALRGGETGDAVHR